MTMGMIEELNESDARKLMDTNFFGALWVCQGVMPYLRSQRSGHIIQITSIGAIISGPMSGIYSASKFALEGMSEALAKEAEHFGVKLTMVEPGGYWTDLIHFDELQQSIRFIRYISPRAGDSIPKIRSEPSSFLGSGSPYEISSQQ